ncbi:Pleckstrin-like proteiny and Zinc finger domain containing protein [Aphelenchoides besseyi]|nr:Pleckstrin-like proteiny and Zinc finger domain containing protein [Aphelenchoides besseyi]KAI6212031.1 Pleckstrin-like proteiny and Zinc finger domain containing protein [Aphelenchoides besseyi]
MNGRNVEDENSMSFTELRAKFAQPKIADKTNGIQTKNEHKPAIAKKPQVPPMHFPKPQHPALPVKPKHLKNLPSVSICPPGNVRHFVQQLDHPNGGSPLATSLFSNRPSSPNVPSDASSDFSFNDFEMSGENSGESSQRSETNSNENTLHGSIIAELIQQGLFKKTATVQSHLPADVDRVRLSTKKEAPSSQETTPTIANQSVLRKDSDDQKDKRKTIEICRPTTSTSSSDDENAIFVYHTGDKKEDERLRDLHGVAYEVYITEKTFVDLLQNIADLPYYIHEYTRRTNNDVLLIASQSKKHVVLRLHNHIQALLPFHQEMLNGFGKIYQYWDSRRPRLAEFMFKHAPYLNQCKPFLTEKMEIVDELSKELVWNKHLARIIKGFEKDVLNQRYNKNLNEQQQGNRAFNMANGNLPLTHQLDSVHQHLTRYLLLMKRYTDLLLPSEQPEYEMAKKAVELLDKVIGNINSAFGTSEMQAKLLELHRKLQGEIDVFAAHRRLVHEGEVKKQTRRNEQRRHLILFSDCLVLCSYVLGGDYFDVNKIYFLPLDHLNLKTEDHVDHEREFTVMTSIKSFVIITETKRDRDSWVSQIEETKAEYLNLLDRWCGPPRVGAIIGKKTGNGATDEEEKLTPTDPNIRFLDDASLEFLNTLPPRRRIELQEWINDNQATGCMVLECKTAFTLITRRHHCRWCGLVICSRCTGYAPIEAMNFIKEKVCPECYNDHLEDFKNLRLFPLKMLEGTSIVIDEQPINDDRPKEPMSKATYWKNIHQQLVKDPFGDAVRILYNNGRRWEHPQNLFRPPTHQGFHRPPKSMLKEFFTNNEELLVTGKVHFSHKKRKSEIRWARVYKDYNIELYKAELDTTPSERFFIHGYSVYEVSEPTKQKQGVEFVLVHVNEVENKRKTHQLRIGVEHPKAVEQWRESLIHELNLSVLDSLD